MLVRLDGQRLRVFLRRRFEQPIGVLAGFGFRLIAQGIAPVDERLVLVRLDGQRLGVFLRRRFEQPIGVRAGFGLRLIAQGIAVFDVGPN